MTENKSQLLISTLKEVLGELAGKDLSAVSPQSTFFELGFDSLLLTQLATLLKKRFLVKITFRQLLEELTTLEAIAGHVAAQMPAGVASGQTSKSSSPATTTVPAAIRPDEPAKTSISTLPTTGSATSATGNNVLERVIREQMALMARQLEMLGDKQTSVSPSPATATKPPPVSAKPVAHDVDGTLKRFGPFKGIEVGPVGGLTPKQEQSLLNLTTRYNRRTAGSKNYAQQHRSHFCDPRAAGNFRQMWKEMVYPIVCTRSKGSKIWDIDGNEYVDLTLGFGANYFGHAPEFVVRAVEEQLGKGFEIGPQSPLAGEAAQMLCEMTGMERATFCNTGSEAVMAAIRVARTVTGRDKIVYFTGDYHGIFDEVLARSGAIDGQPGALPIAPGIPSLPYVMVLDYGNPSSLKMIQSHANEIAAVLVEPVQSRHPDHQPREFLQALRQITIKNDIALIFDEVVTGMRAAPGGAQEYFGVRADLATYGKVVGGGMPIGVLAGTRRFMDALDGGMWQFGDDSFPEVGVTFFAGTFVRHPLAVAAAHATLRYLKETGPKLQQQTTEKTARLIRRLNDYFASVYVPIRFQTFSSMFFYDFHPDLKFAGLLFYHLRDRGVHIWEGRVGQICTTHTENELNFVFEAFKSSVEEMRKGGFLPEDTGNENSLHELTGFFNLEGSQVAAKVPVNSSPLTEKSAKHTDEAGQKMDFSIYLFGSYAAEYHPNKYRLVIEAAKFADVNGFKAIWLPERHFHAVGGFSPNPSVIAAALARETEHLHLRAGSVVLPLHHPVRIAEEWSVVDNLSNGRIGISIASGWHPNDFVFAPAAFENRRELCWEGYEIIQKLWQGNEVEFPTGGQNRHKVKLHPMPKQPRLPAWLTCIHKESYVKAGELGIGVLGYTMNTTLDELAEKIQLYRDAFTKHGHDPAQCTVTILLHTFISADCHAARSVARQPMQEYLRSYLDNSQKRLESQNGQPPVDEEDIQYLLDRAFDDYINGKALIGSPASCAKIVAALKSMGVNEIGCFLDFGIDPETVLAQLPQIVELKRLCESAQNLIEPPANVSNDPSGGLNHGRIVALTDEQRGLVTVAALGKNASRAYTEGNTLEIRGSLNIPMLRRALQKCVDRHEALRTALNADGESQTIHPKVELSVGFEDFSTLPPSRQQTELQSLFEKMETESFDLQTIPGMWSCIIKLAEDRHWLLLFFHHTLGNGPAYWIFFDDLFVFYDSECGGVPCDKPQPMQLSDFVEWRATRSKSAEYADDESFWMGEFSNLPPALELPLDYTRPARKSYLGGRAILRLDQNLVREARKTGAAHQCSLYMVLLTTYMALMHRLSGQNDVVVGTPFESQVRSLPGGEGLFANTTNMTPLRSFLQKSSKFSQLLLATKRQVLRCQEHQDFFFGNLFRKLGIRSDSGRAGLFSVGFNFETGKYARRIHGAEIEFLTNQVPYRCPKDTAMFDLNLNIAEQDGELLCECDYDSDIFTAASVQRLLHQFNLFLQTVAVNPEREISELDLLNKFERHQILVDWNQTEKVYARDHAIHSLFEAEARNQPDKIAVQCGERSLTYRELDLTADRLAGSLSRMGIQAGSLVGIYLERSVEMVVGVMGILKSGAAYVPMDPAFPAERLAGMVAEAKMTVIVTHSDLLSKLPAHAAKIVCVDTVPESSPSINSNLATKAEDLAYVIFTSGSTGQPKGVQVQHRAVVNLLNSMRREPGIQPNDVVLSVTTLSFDVAGLELFLPLTSGATLVVATRETAADGNLLRQELEQRNVTFMQATPVTWTMLIEAGWTGRSELKILCGGEALSRELARQLIPRCNSLWNMYGPTETTIWSTTCRITEANGSVSIGRPIDNTQVYIVDENLQPTPVGIPGELLIGGDGLAVGYLNQPELTAEKFIRNPFELGSGSRLYRTGDLAKYLTDGNIDLLGRNDQQVKLRGFRIELGEIESMFRTHPSVKDCVVILREDVSDHKQLVGYASLRNSSAGDNGSDQTMVATKTVAELKVQAQASLPAYMVPAAIVILDSLPRTPNGKINRKALPAPVVNPASGRREFVAPRNEKEQALAMIWMEVLGLEKVSVMDNFFELGGDSLSSFRVANRANLAGLPLKPRMFFQHNTIAGLVKAADEVGSEPPKIVISRAQRSAHRHKLTALN